MKNVGQGRDGPEIEIELRLRGDVAAGLINAANGRGMRPIDLLASVIETVCTEDLFTAVVDEDS